MANFNGAAEAGRGLQNLPGRLPNLVLSAQYYPVLGSAVTFLTDASVHSYTLAARYSVRCSATKTFPSSRMLG